MSGDSHPYSSTGKKPRWVLSAKDNVILTELYTALRRWLLAAATAKDVIALGHILGALKNLIEHGVVPGSGEADINSRSYGKYGIGAHLSLSSEAIMLGLMEFVDFGDQGLDQEAIRDTEGRPFYLEFTPDGSFDRVKFDFWLSHTDDLAPFSFGEDGAQALARWFS